MRIVRLHPPGVGARRVGFEFVRQRRSVLEMRSGFEQVRRSLGGVAANRRRCPRDGGRIDPLLPLEPCRKHERVAQEIDATRDAVGEDEDFGESGVLELGSAGPPGPVQAVLDVQADLRLLQRSKVTIDADQFAKTASLRGVEQDAELGLTDETDLQANRS
jgi:hypothetical protein